MTVAPLSLLGPEFTGGLGLITAVFMGVAGVLGFILWITPKVSYRLRIIFSVLTVAFSTAGAISVALLSWVTGDTLLLLGVAMMLVLVTTTLAKID